MKLFVDSLGRIAHAELDIRPFTVFIGKNGTNKTWTAHAYFKLLERLRVVGRQDQPVSGERIRPPPAPLPTPTHADRGDLPQGRPRARKSTRAAAVDPTAAVVAAVATEWMTRISEVPSGSVSFSVGRNDLVLRLPETITFDLQGPVWPSTLGTTLLITTRVRLELSRDEFMKGSAVRLEVTVDREPLRVQRALFLEGEPEPWTKTEYPGAGDLERALREVIKDLLFGWRKHVRALPVERLNLVQLFGALLSAEQRSPMPRALVDFCYMMAQASATAVPRSEAPFLVDALAALAGGHFIFDENREVVFRPADAGDIPIKAAASFAKSVAGLGVFLSSAAHGDVLIIDEPEMNAHPETQVALVELFASMVRFGMEVVVLTHSPYVVDHLSTLLEASRLDAAQRAEIRSPSALGAADVYLAPEDLAVYQFEPSGDVRSVLDRSTGVIDWSTFTAVSDRESVTMNALIEKEQSGEHGA